MERRKFFGLVSTAALVATALTRQMGRAEMEPQPKPNFEPAPIDLPEATVTHARDLLRQLQAATIDRSQFAPEMNDILTDERLQSGASYIRPYGDPSAFTPVQLQTTAEGSAAFFRVKFATDTLTWVVRVAPDGRVNGFALRHSERNKLYSVFTRLIEGY